MIKKELYPKTKRVKMKNAVVVTEKLEGSNLGLFNLNNELIIAQRGTIYKLDEIEDIKDFMYRGLYQWLKDNGQALLDNLHDGSGIFGEWIGMGQIKYQGKLEKRFYMFCKANIISDLTIKNLNHDIELFNFPFLDLEIPEFMDIVPIVEYFDVTPSKEELDVLFDKYSTEKDRDVEGFIVNANGLISKYVRRKNGKLKDHHE